ncbi:MAG: OmpH family outer membrane protein [Alistipes sp.]|nr:OmpH family outer membrane protein [Alistipes sp.]
MKRFFIAVVAMMLTAGAAMAQNYMVVDSEKVFKSLAEYNNALEQIESLSAQYQKQVDAKFAEVEKMYNTYMQQRASLSASVQQQREKQILDSEAAATEYQQSLFGTDGQLMKKRMELIQPIQKRVFSTLESFAKQNGYDLVIDISANPTVLYYSEKVNFTDKIIEALK